MEFSIVYSDKEIAVCEKPSGMLSQSDEKGEAGLKELLEKLPVVSNVYLLAVAMLGWVIFCYSDLSLVKTLFGSLFGLYGNGFTDWMLNLELQNSMFLYAAAIIGCTPAVKLLCEALEKKAYGSGKWAEVWNVLYYSVLPVILLLLSTAALVGDSYNPFIYFQF